MIAESGMAGHIDRSVRSSRRPSWSRDRIRLWLIAGLLPLSGRPAGPEMRRSRAEQQAQMQQMAAAAQMAQTAQQGAGAVRQAAQAAEGGGLGQIAELLGAGGEGMA